MPSTHRKKPENHLPLSFWQVDPKLARCTLTTTQLRSTLLYHEGRIYARGQAFEIRARSLGAGVYEVTLSTPGESQ